MSELKLHCFEEGKWCVMQLQGSVDAFTFHDLEDALTRLVEAGSYYLKFDLENVVSINSTGMGLLLATHRQVRRKGGRLVVEKMGADIANIFNLLGLLQLLDGHNEEGFAGVQ